MLSLNWNDTYRDIKRPDFLKESVLQEQFIALIIAVLPASIAFWVKLRTESLAGRRLVVSYLLQIRHAIICSTLTSEKLLTGFDDVFERLCTKHGLDSQEHVGTIQKLRSIVASMYEQTVQTLLPDLGNEFWADFEQALKALRKEEPLLAFQLVGWEKDLAFLKINQSYATQFTEMDEIRNVEFVKDILDQHLNQDHGTHYAEITSQLDVLLRAVAKSAGLWTYVSIILYLRKRPAKVFKFEGENAFVELESELEAMFKKLTEWSNQVDAEEAEQNKATSSS